MKSSGLHHVTAMASDPVRNAAFYTATLGLRLVKKTVNFDDPGTYHLYFGDQVGTPGTILTFFPIPDLRRGRAGVGQATSFAFQVPTGSLDFWNERLRSRGLSIMAKQTRFGNDVLGFLDPDGFLVELVETVSPATTQIPEADGIPTSHAIRAFHGVTLLLRNHGPTSDFLTRSFGARFLGQEANRRRYLFEETGSTVDLIEDADGSHGTGGAGTIHHVAFRSSDDDAQRAAREALLTLGFSVSPVMDRTYFHSIYFREPGGVLFEIATDGPGFAIDESVETLGQNLKLPPWVEARREMIESLLPPLAGPS